MADCCKADEYGGWCDEFLDYLIKYEISKVSERDRGVVRDSDIYEKYYGNHNGAIYCIFHLPTVDEAKIYDHRVQPRPVSVDLFNYAIMKRIDYAVGFQKTVVFDGTHFTYEFDLSKVYGTEINCHLMHFKDTIFEKKATFSYCKINCAMVFTLSTFRGDLYFKDCKVKGDLDFSHVSCEGLVDLRGTVFNGSAIFYHVDFDKEVYLHSMTFNGKVSFSKAWMKGVCEVSGVFEKEAEFVGARFDENVNFRDANFKDLVHFDGALFQSSVIFYGETFLNGLSMQEVWVGKNARFENCKVSKAQFLGTNVDKIDFINCVFVGEKGNEKLYDEASLFLNEDSVDSTIKKIKKVESLYRQLKERAVNDQYWERVSNWHYREKEVVKKKLKFITKYYYKLEDVRKMHSGEEFIGGKKVALKKAAICLYSFLSGYNEKPLVAIRTLILLLSISMVVFGSFGFWFDNKDCLPLVCVSWYKLGIIKAFGLLPFVSVDNEVVKSFLVFESVDLNYFEKELGKSFWEQLFAVTMQVFVYIQVALLGMSVRNKLRR